MSRKAASERIQAKCERLDAARIKAEEFVGAGGDLTSAEAAPIGVELALAANELASEFGHPFLENIK
jgi:hypothetical protein